MSNLYWLAHQRFVENGRMRWHAETADQAFWSGYWHDRVSPSYYESARRMDLRADELGRILLAEMPRQGVHLEAGCGAGYWVAALRAAGYDVEGIEYSRELVDLVNGVEPGLPVIYGDALAIDRPDNTYASYLSFGVVEHRPEGPEPFLREAFRVLRPGGALVITIPHFGPVRRLKARLGRYGANTPQSPFFQYGFTRDDFQRLVSQAGFEVDYTRPLSVHRLMLEESGAYRWLNDHRGQRVWRRAADGMLDGRDGHMLLVAAHKPGDRAAE